MEYLEAIAERGFAPIPRLFREPEITALLGNIAESNLPRTRAGVRHALRCPQILALAKDARLVEVASEILGGAAFPYRASLFEKLPTANWLTVWHQDTALPVRERRDLPGWGPWSVKGGVEYGHAPASALRKMISLRVHLDESTDRNGPLRVLPGTHNLGVLTADQIRDLATRIRPVTWGSRKGGVVAMRPLLVHSSTKSQTPEYRRVLHVEYATETKIAAGIELAVM